ncbi:unnamed protein product [Leuciscus chuanchicus]
MAASESSSNTVAPQTFRSARRHALVPLKDKKNSVENYFRKKNTTPCTPQEAAILTESVLSMIVKARYTLPCRRHFTTMMENKYETSVEKLKNKLKMATSKISLSTDAWTSLVTEAYLGVTSHFIDDSWDLVSFNLTTLPVEERHTAENIASWLENVAEKFDISFENVLAIVHDNARNIVAALRILEERFGVVSHRCAGHTLQLVVNHAMVNPVINKALSATRCLVKHIKKSEPATTKLKLKQKQMGTVEHKRIQDVAVRWNSSYYMIEHLLEQRWPVVATLSDPEITQRGKHYLDLKNDLWILLEELEEVLKLYEQATVFLSVLSIFRDNCGDLLRDSRSMHIFQSKEGPEVIE